VKAEQAKAAADHADNCQRARRALATVNSGMRIATVNDKANANSWTTRPWRVSVSGSNPSSAATAHRADAQ